MLCLMLNPSIATLASFTMLCLMLNPSIATLASFTMLCLMLNPSIATLARSSAASLAALPISEQVLGQPTPVSHSSDPSQQSHTVSPTLLEGITKDLWPAFSQQNF